MPAARKAVVEAPADGDWMSLLEAAAAIGISRTGVLALIAAQQLSVKQIAINSRQSRTLVSRESVEQLKAKRAERAAR